VSGEREHLAEVTGSSRRTGAPADLTRRGRAVAMDRSVFERLLYDAEGMPDRAELEIPREEDGYTTWGQVTADLGRRDNSFRCHHACQPDLALTTLTSGRVTIARCEGDRCQMPRNMDPKFATR
jgi:hypothetical protein